MRNFVQPGETLTVAAPANVSSGDVVVVGALLGVAAYDALSGAEVEIATEGVFDLPCASADDIAAGVTTARIRLALAGVTGPAA